MTKGWAWLSFLIAAAIFLRVSSWLLTLRLAPDSIENNPIFLVLGTIEVLSRLGPAFLAGWFARRHGLTIGFLIGVGSSLVIYLHFYHYQLISYSLFGLVVASGIESAVAGLAGQALRYRLPPNNSFKPNPHQVS